DDMADGDIDAVRDEVGDLVGQQAVARMRAATSGRAPPRDLRLRDETIKAGTAPCDRRPRISPRSSGLP
ncbi:hypothetical protein, partial [Tardiphaga sp.]|uniref:hypothetical protein n=1 Tax=Tardiphaga sp. TaxID=1926292 RepID=UPI0025F68CAA